MHLRFVKTFPVLTAMQAGLLKKYPCTNGNASSKTSVQKPHLIVYPGVRDANHDLVHTHEESLQYEETGWHHALMTQTSCFSKLKAV